MKNYIKLLFFFVIAFYGFPKQGVSQEIVLSEDQKIPKNITSSIEILKDSTGKLTLEQVAAMNFKKSPKDHIVFPYSDDVFWVRFSLKNTNAANKDWILVWTNPLVEQLDIYISDTTGQKFSHKRQKILTVEKEKKLIDQDPTFTVDLSPNQRKNIYVKVTSKRGHYMTLRLHSEKTYYKSKLESFAGQSFFNGLVIFRLFLVLTLSLFIINNFAFRLYSLHTVIKTFAFWGYLNIAGPWFTDDPDVAKKIDFLFYNSVTLGGGIFVYFTQVRGKFSKIHTIIAMTIILLTIFESIIVFVDYQWYWLKLGVYSIIISATYFSGLYLYSIVKKIAIEKYYAIPFILGMISYALLYIRLLGWIEYEPVYSIAYLLFLGEIFVFVIFLGGIFRSAEQKLNFSIEQNSRLKELDNLKTSFFANISHEFRTPLTLILSPLKDLRREFPERDIFRVMQQNAERLLALINQLLDLSKLEAGKMDMQLQRSDLAQFLNYLFASFESLGQNKKILFQYEQSQLNYVADFDQDKIEKVVTNLLSNAFKFTPPNGRVQVRVDYQKTQLLLKVQDFGIGIDPQRLPRIFDRFYQADSGDNRTYEGTGIGLALVKELVQVMKGSINVESKVGEGSIFTVMLPMLEESEAPKGQVVVPINMPKEQALLVEELPMENPINDGKEVLLIVEDNPELRAYIREIFAPHYDLLEASDGQEGLEKAIEELPDVVICDLMMPRLDGFGFCKAMKNNELTNHIPIIMLTAKATLTDRLEGLELGADDYLSKPFDREELQVRVRNLIKQRQVLLQKYTKNKASELAQKSQVEEETALKNRINDEQFMQHCHEVLMQHLGESGFDVERFAEAMNVSAVQLRRKLKASTGQGVIEYLRNFRLEKAAEMLANKTETVSEVAYKVGFESLSYFSKMFFEKYEKSPSDWS
ncbi:ATP-binding protein [Runella limosa]|uniref:ATP-binding protein n=1 Tax=Runella limosa TaxID=370978 RepID=UPI00146F9A08|nr:ATP-binding protein [Runella limosa]